MFLKLDKNQVATILRRQPRNHCYCFNNENESFVHSCLPDTLTSSNSVMSFCFILFTVRGIEPWGTLPLSHIASLPPLFSLNCWSWPWTWDYPTLASQETAIISVCHCASKTHHYYYYFNLIYLPTSGFYFIHWVIICHY